MAETYQSYTYESPNSIKRWLHRKRFVDAVKILGLKPNETVLDYGCGDGYFLELASRSHPKELIEGFEPAQVQFDQATEKLKGQGLRVVQDLAELKGRKFDKIICMETCEHLPNSQLHELIVNIKSLLLPNGRFIVSVPIEIGLPALAKNSFRFVKNPRYGNLSLKSYFRTFLGLHVQRDDERSISGLTYIFSHIGFNFKEFERELKKHFIIRREQCSPIEQLGNSLNMTKYYNCEILYAGSGESASST
jgi:2-polyprenyl-3-methyl-5-hydroxy-6-metoxy-1,4-benzoquinol methylase